jgi:uncharacterized membrane protein YgcG
MSILPFQRWDVVRWRGEDGVVLEVRGDRVVVETGDGVVHITTDEVLRLMQPVRAA